jgi:transaldolase/glucose-6-phosphate isomerase
MGGSSLAPEVFQRTFGNRPGRPRIRVLDSTHPGAVDGMARSLDLRSTLFLVSSKSGTTIEPLSFFEFFWERVAAMANHPGDHFAAITDPGTRLADEAGARGFRRVFTSISDVGGRYSALTHFGLVPAALIGADVSAMLDAAGTMAASSRAGGGGLPLGAALGEMALAGRDKATFLVSDSLAAFPDWTEQLIAESTGKDGTGILPVAGEAAGPPDAYGPDRFFVWITLTMDEGRTSETVIDELEAAGHPVARIELDTKEDLAAEMYRAEIAVAMAGSVLGIHPFDQPDVQRAKVLARQAMSGELAAGEIVERPAEDPGLAAALAGLLAGLNEGGYFAIQAFVPPSKATGRSLQRIRHLVRDRHRVATTLGFGPRFLHSTGQFHKGGPAGGVFLQIVDHPHPDLPVPGAGHSFGDLVSGQADGDHLALADAGRPVLRVCLGDDVADGLTTLERALRA